MENFFDNNTIKDEYDLVIVGGGPAGCAAAIYASRDELDTLVLEKLSPGGQMATTGHIDNMPGFSDTIEGIEASLLYHKHATRFGATFRYGDVVDFKVEGDMKLLYLEGREKPIRAKTVIIATGCRSKKLEIPGEDKFWGRGVSLCGTCDGSFYKGKVIASVGGGNSALEETIYLTRYATKIYLIHRRQEFRANKVVQTQIRKNPKIELVLDSVVTSIEGDDKINHIAVKNVVSGAESKIDVDGIFIFVGQIPVTGPFGKILKTDETGFIMADETTLTSIPGVFVAGDVRVKEIRQIVTAISDGAVAAKMAAKYLQERS